MTDGECAGLHRLRQPRVAVAFVEWINNCAELRFFLGVAPLRLVGHLISDFRPRLLCILAIEFDI